MLGKCAEKIREEGENLGLTNNVTLSDSAINGFRHDFYPTGDDRGEWIFALPDSEAP